MDDKGATIVTEDDPSGRKLHHERTPRPEEPSDLPFVAIRYESSGSIFAVLRL